MYKPDVRAPGKCPKCGGRMHIRKVSGQRGDSESACCSKCGYTEAYPYAA